jgi:hypothetical protein
VLWKEFHTGGEEESIGRAAARQRLPANQCRPAGYNLLHWRLRDVELGFLFSIGLIRTTRFGSRKVSTLMVAERS